MARTVKEAKLDSRAARARLKRGRQPHWRALKTRVHLGYQCWKGEPEGRWLLRRYIGGGNKYRLTTIGRADDAQPANGTTHLSYEQAAAKAGAMVADVGCDTVTNLTVRQAMERYMAYKAALGQSAADVKSRGTAHILPALGDLVVSELTADTLRRWLATMAAAPAQTRPKKGKVQFRPEPEGDEAIRKRRATANRVLTMLKAMLNHAYDEGHVSARDAWGRKLKPFRAVEVARVRYLSIAEARRLLNGCDPDFRSLVRGALETGARYGELARTEVADFNGDSGTLTIRKSKTSKARHIVLTEEGAAFFKTVCAGRPGHTLIFTKANGERWKVAEQARPMRAANERAKVSPQISFHGLRHTWASHAVMNGVPLMVVSKNLGHRDTTMVERHYGHLAPSFIVDAIRAGAPKFGPLTEKKVVPLNRPRNKI